MSGYKVSVVIPCKNRAELLFECFSGLARQSLECDQFEIVLVDDSSPQPLDVVAEP
jgi:glycosyltransferase involved in cell wall biosynthesis